MVEFWNERYKTEDYAYGTLPNVFFKETVAQLKLKGDFLFAAEGEGRNAVYAAELGNHSCAFDTSEEGKNKALKLANEKSVSIDYSIASFDDFKTKNQFDAVVLCYAHLPADALKRSYLKMARFVKTGGYILIEGFSKEHQQFQKISKSAGGPKDISMLFAEDTLVSFLRDFEIIKAETVTTTLDEGSFHQGEASVVRIIAKKLK